MEQAGYEIGVRHNEAGEPLFYVDGKLLGTVPEVKALIRRFDDLEQAGAKSFYDTVGDDYENWAYF